MNCPNIENPDKITRRSESFDESRNNISIIGNSLRGPALSSVDYRQFYRSPRLLPSITTSAKEEHRRSLFSYKNKLKAERKGKTEERGTNVSPQIQVNFLEVHPKLSNERNLNSSNGQLVVSLGLASEQGGRFTRSSYNYSDITPMASEHYNRDPGSFVGPKSPAPAYPRPLTLAINPRSEENKDSLKSSGQIMYPNNNNRFANRFRKDNWRTVKKSTRKVIPKVRNISTGCCSTYVATVRNIQSKWSLLFLVHCSLFLMLAGYIVIGASMVMKTDGGSRYAVRGAGEIQRTKEIRGIAAERLLNISLKSVVEKSRDAVLDTIFTSDTLQAALSAFKTSRVAFLPADHELQLLSQSVLEDWEKRLDYLLVRYHFISTIETMGHQMSPEELRIAWGPADNSEKPRIPMKMLWNFGDASMQCFCLITTMGSTAKSSSDGGKVSTIIYALFGIPLYWWVIFIWSHRLLDVLLVITRTSANTSNRRKIAISEEDRILTPNWNSPPPYKKETPPFLIFLSSTLTIAYVIGLGPLACGTDSNSFWERLEAAFSSLLTVRPPAPLPRGIETVLGFMLYIIVGHLMIGAFIRSIKMVGDSVINRIFSSPTR